MHLMRKIGIDLGTANTRVWLEGRGVVMNEPTVVVSSMETHKVLAVGTQAKTMLGRAPSNILASQPMRGGVIADYVIVEAMLRFLLQSVVGKSFLFKPEVMISVPAGSTQVERHAVVDAALSAGARTAYLIDNPLAAIVGAGLPIAEATGNMVVDIGAGVAEAAVVSLGGVVASRSVRVAGNIFDESIVKYVRKQFNVSIGEQTAEQVKREIGSAVEVGRGATLEIKGRDSVQGLPHEVRLTSSDVYTALHKPLSQVSEMVKKVLETVPPELASDIIDKGIVLTGGSARLQNLDAFMTNELNVPTTVADKPDLCVIHGIGMVFERVEEYRHALQVHT
ncbi:MAG TPA: rod shape-determining protein [Candidatus Saccharimonadia bacterium]|nr:rod shape-determining protein [Candidatus Saccharimonadia bacterium]